MEIMLTTQELRRYNRQISLPEIGEIGQLKLKNAKVIVVGAGGLGCAVLQYLTIAGIGLIGIIDNDIVSETNLYRQTLYGAGDLGKLKTVIVREKLRVLNPLVNIDIHNLKLTNQNATKLLGDFDFVIDCSGDLATSYIINDACVLIKKIMIHGAFCNFDGVIGAFNFPGKATFRCAFPKSETYPFFPETKQIGDIGITPGIIGTILTSEVIKHITGIGINLINRYLIINLLKNEFETIIISPNPENQGKISV